MPWSVMSNGRQVMRDARRAINGSHSVISGVGGETSKSNSFEVERLRLTTRGGKETNEDAMFSANPCSWWHILLTLLIVRGSTARLDA